jgi:hypothetical protein
LKEEEEPQRYILNGRENRYPLSCGRLVSRVPTIERIKEFGDAERSGPKEL